MLDNPLVHPYFIFETKKGVYFSYTRMELFAAGDQSHSDLRIFLLLDRRCGAIKTQSRFSRKNEK
jgi:hypothetical protein